MWMRHTLHVHMGSSEVPCNLSSILNLLTKAFIHWLGTRGVGPVELRAGNAPCTADPVFIWIHRAWPAPGKPLTHSLAIEHPSSLCGALIEARFTAHWRIKATKFVTTGKYLHMWVPFQDHCISTSTGYKSSSRNFVSEILYTVKVLKIYLALYTH